MATDSELRSFAKDSRGTPTFLRNPGKGTTMSMIPEDEQALFDDVKAIAALATQGMDYETKRVGDMRSLFIKIFRIKRHWTEKP